MLKIFNRAFNITFYTLAALAVIAIVLLNYARLDVIDGNDSYGPVTQRVLIATDHIDA